MTRVLECTRCFGTGGSYDVTAEDAKGRDNDCRLCRGTGVVTFEVHNAWAYAFPWPKQDWDAWCDRVATPRRRT